MTLGKTVLFMFFVPVPKERELKGQVIDLPKDGLEMAIHQ